MVTQTAATHPAPLGGCSPEGCCCWKREVPTALLLRLAFCSPYTPHLANEPRPRPRPRRPVWPSHQHQHHHPALPQLSLPITPSPPRVPRPISSRPHFPCHLASLRAAPSLSSATVGSPNVLNQRIRRRDSPLLCCQDSNSGSGPALRPTAVHFKTAAAAAGWERNSFSPAVGLHCIGSSPRLSCHPGQQCWPGQASPPLLCPRTSQLPTPHPTQRHPPNPLPSARTAGQLKDPTKTECQQITYLWWSPCLQRWSLGLLQHPQLASYVAELASYVAQQLSHKVSFLQLDPDDLKEFPS